ncbi:MAG: hypothetical protein ABTR54_00750 [Candidatus Competibacter sp.]
MAADLTIQHLGRMTRVVARGREANLKKLRNALLLKEFRVVAERENRLVLRRRAYVLQDDWPMTVVVDRDGDRFDIRYSLFIPWGWIVGLVFLTLVVLPFAGIPNALLAFGLATVVAILAVYRQKFDCRPNARFWQERPRKRWGETMEEILREAFARL